MFSSKAPKKLESSQNADRQKGEQGQTLLAVDDLRELDVLILLVGIDDHLAAAILGHLYVDDGTDEFGKTVRGRGSFPHAPYSGCSRQRSL